MARSLSIDSCGSLNSIGLAEQVVVVVDVGHEPGALLEHHLNALVVDQAAVLDRVDAGHQGVLDPLRPVRVGGDLAAGGVRLLDRGPQLLDRELGRAGRIAARQHAAGGVHLDHVDPVLDLRANDVAHLVDAVGDLEVALLGKHRDAHLGRKAVQVAVAAGHRDARPAGHDPRTDQKSLVDRSREGRPPERAATRRRARW